MKDCELIRLPAGLCLYSGKAEATVRELIQLGEELHLQGVARARGVLLLQTAPADDRTEDWGVELANDTLFLDLEARIEAVRWLLTLIRNSPVPWIYAAADDCLGSGFELALSCQRRYWFASGALVGLPDIATGAFPPGGVLESLSRRTGRTKDLWQSRPTQSAAEALGDGLVHFCTDAAIWEPHALQLFGELLQANPKVGVREGGRRREKITELPVPGHASQKAAIEQLESVWKYERLAGHKYPSAWDYCWQLLKEHAKLEDPRGLGRLIAHIAAQHMLSGPYLSWISANLVAARVRTRPAGTLPQTPVVVHVETVAPPTEVFIRLLNTLGALVLVAGEAKELTVALNLIYSRLERSLGAVLAQSLWERRVTWCQAQAEEVGGIFLRWTVDDGFIVRAGPRTLQFLRLEGNAGAAVPGLLEWPLKAGETATLEPPLAALIDLAADGYVVTYPSKKSPLPLTVNVRSLFFEEMLHISRNVGGDFAAVTEALKGAGWRFAGDDEAWDRFLKSRTDMHAFDAELSRYGARALDRSKWEIGSVKHARALAKRSAASSSRRWNATATSLHMAIFLGLLAESLAAGGRLAQAADSDFLCAKALGFPDDLGTPLTFLAKRGRRRVEYYAQSHWPLLLRGLPGESTHDLQP